MKDRMRHQAVAICPLCTWFMETRAETAEQARLTVRCEADRHNLKCHPKPMIKVTLEVDRDGPPDRYEWTVGQAGVFLGSHYRVISIE